MKVTKKVWIYWLIASIAVLLGYETWTLVNGVANDTLSEAVWDWSERYPYVPFFTGLVIGLLCGHFFWCPNRGSDRK